MHRRIGEHQADVAEVRGDARRDFAAAPGEHDRTRPAREQRSLGRADFGQTLGAREIGDHHRERFCVARLAPAEARHRRLVMRVAEEMEAAEPLQRHDASRLQDGRGVLDRDVELRSAAGTGDRLGVEAPVRRIGIVARAVRAHRERRHRSLRPVVGERARQRIAGAAMGAVDQRVAEEAARRVEQLFETGVAHGRVGADAGGRPALPRGVDDESLAADRRDRGGLDRVRCARAAAAPAGARPGRFWRARLRSRSARPRRRCARSRSVPDATARP